MPVEDLKQSQMMNHMLEALENGEDIGHYGRLTFVMVGFISRTTTSWCRS
jgi:hypothetical protein